MLFKQPYKKAEHLTPMINIGAGFDIIAGKWYDGQHGEALLNGGHAQLSGYVGGGNMFKTAGMLFKNLTAMYRIHNESTGSMFETELNTHAGRITDLASVLPEYDGVDPIETERFIITNRKHYSGEEWYDETKDFLEQKVELGKKKEYRAKLPFMKLGTTELMEMIIPTFGGLDSFTDFVTKDVSKMNDDVKLGEKGAEMMFMKQGVNKLRLLSEFPPLLHKAAHYFSMTAQMGPIFQMDTYNPEKKKLSDIQGNLKMKGVTEKFTTNLNSILQFYNLEKLLNKTTKLPQFPRDEFDNEPGDSDLRVLSCMELRGKAGPSGTPIRLIVSQKNGVLPHLTEFYNIWSHPDSYGLSGNDQNYSLILRPDAKLSRTKVRSKIDSDPMLQRALHITMEMMQMSRLMPELRSTGLLCTPQELFDGVKERGYDWDMILGNTRGWWTLNNDDHPVPYLSTLDLMRMRLDKYKPYWM